MDFEISIAVNKTMGQVTLRVNRHANCVTYDLDHTNKLGEIVQEYFNKYCKETYLRNS